MVNTESMANNSATFVGLLTHKDVEEIENRMNQEGINRRTALLFLSLSKDEIVSKFGESEEDIRVLLDTIQALDSYIESLVHCTEIAQTAIARLLTVAIEFAGEQDSSSS